MLRAWLLCPTLLVLLLQPARAEPLVLKLATVAPDHTPWAEVLHRFAQAVDARSRGRLHVQLYLGGQQGGEVEAVLKCKRGQLQGVSASTGAMASQVPALSVVEVPFLFRDEAEADRVLDGVLARPLQEAMRKAGLQFGFWSENGFRHLGTRTVVHTLADLRGRKMRAQESPLHLQLWQAWGAAAVAIPVTETLPALQQGTVDGFDQAIGYTVAGRWAAAIGHYTLTAHIYQPAVIVWNAAWFDALPADLRQILAQEGAIAQALGRRTVRAMTPRLLDALRNDGVQVRTPTPEERSAFARAALPVRDWFRQTRDADSVRLLELALAATTRP
jgi:TRAP-type C4-dicarboxylate transport system substrate-binding protein